MKGGKMAIMENSYSIENGYRVYFPQILKNYYDYYVTFNILIARALSKRSLLHFFNPLLKKSCKTTNNLI